jgi:hypothetical protein
MAYERGLAVSYAGRLRLSGVRRSKGLDKTGDPYNLSGCQPSMGRIARHPAAPEVCRGVPTAPAVAVRTPRTPRRA